MLKREEKIITRFAPSPTGFMHVGNLRTGLFAWLWARKNNGIFILRIEDTDKKREVKGSMEHVKNSLNWIGIDWDEGPDIGGPHGPYVQSERITTLKIYEKYAQELIKRGYAYADLNTEEYLEKLRKQAEVEKRAFLYREHRPENPPIWKLGIPLRFKIKEPKRTVWNDVVRGELTAGPEALDDFILIKSDGYPTYNFAHIVDDIEMGITHVVRGQEFISSTPNYIAVYEALEVPQPQYVTVPPIMGEQGNKKMGKREGAKDVLEYEKEGYLPDAMLNFLALLGWNPGDDREIFKRDELMDIFDISKIQRSGAKLNEEKLEWINKEHIKLLTLDEQLQSVRSNFKIHNPTLEMTKKLLPIVMDRIHKWGDIEVMEREGEFEYFFDRPLFSEKLIYWKGVVTLEITKKNLEWVSNVLLNASSSNFESVESIKSLIYDYATENGRGEVLWPLRVSLSGKEKSPDPFTLIYILGKDESLSRISSVIKNLQ